MGYICENSGFSECMLQERENYYRKKGLEGKTLVGIDEKGEKYTEIYEEKTSDKYYKILYADANHYKFEELEKQGYTFVFQGNKQVVFSSNTMFEDIPELGDIEKKSKIKEIISPFIKMLSSFSFFLLIVVRCFFGNLTLEEGISGAYYVIFGVMVFMVLYFTACLFQIIKKLLKFQIHRVINILCKCMVKIFSVAFIIAYLISYIPFLTFDKEYSCDYVPPALFNIYEVEPNAIKNLESTNYEKGSLFFGDYYYLWENAKYEDTSFYLREKIYVCTSRKQANMIVNYYIWTNNKGIFKHDMKDKTDSSLNAGFDKIYEYDYIYDYLILKDNIIIEYEMEIYGENDEIKNQYEHIALQKLSESISRL